MRKGNSVYARQDKRTAPREPGALATVLGANSVDVTSEEPVDAVFAPALQGSLPEEIAATARRYGRLAYPLQPSVAELIREVAQGHPVLILQNPGTRWFPRWHFAVVVGNDLATQAVILRYRRRISSPAPSRPRPATPACDADHSLVALRSRRFDSAR